MKIWILAFLLLPRAAFAEDTRVAVQILWDYKDLPAGMKIYEPSGKPQLWKTEAVKDEKLIPLGKEIEGGTLKLAPGQAHRFLLVYKNATDQPIYFFAAPHAAEPPENSLGFKFKCLCVNHAYRAQPGETWYRVVEFRLSKVFADKRLAIRHTLIGISEAKAESINSAPPVEANQHEM